MELEHKNSPGTYFKKYPGISIENGPRQGFQYFDSTGAEYGYRYVTSTVTNDSSIPVQLNIFFTKENHYAHSTDYPGTRVFLLPRKLTPWRQQFDRTMSSELKRFLDTGLQAPVFLNKIVSPNERCVITFGVLTEVSYKEPFLLELITKESLSGQMSSTGDSLISLGLVFDNKVFIPCGQITFPLNKVKVHNR